MEEINILGQRFPEVNVSVKRSKDMALAGDKGLIRKHSHLLQISSMAVQKVNDPMHCVTILYSELSR